MNIWYSVQGGSDKPDEFDETSSKVYIYLRKDFEQIVITDCNGTKYTIWQWMEQKIRKEDWAIYQATITNASDVTDIQEALVELYEMIGG